MKARILDSQVKVYSSTDANSVSIATLPEGSEVEFGGARRKAGKLWVPITMSTGQQAFIPGDTRIYVIQQGILLQNDVELHAEASAGSMVKQRLARSSKVDILQVLRQEGGDWVRVRDVNGMEGFIQGNTRIRVSPQKTKAGGRKNMLTGVMWLIAGLLITFTNSSSSSGSGYILFGYMALVFGAVMVISGLMQLLKAKA